MNPLSVVESVTKKVKECAVDFRRQAPGARIVGEFAVRHVVGLLTSRLGGGPVPPSGKARS